MNWGMLGHEWAVQLLKGQIERDRVQHAYLITGPQGVGRRTLAVRFAQALNCPTPLSTGEPCGTCSTCIRIEKLIHPDLIIVQSEGRDKGQDKKEDKKKNKKKGNVLIIDKIRELSHFLTLTPYEARYKVALLLHFEEANQNAANALLKTLEEPAPSVVLILTADSEESLLPTIVSRCQVLRLQPLPLEAVKEDLRERCGVTPERAALLAHISGGCPGYAFQLAGKKTNLMGDCEEDGEISEDGISFLEERDKWLEDHQKLLSADRVQRFVYARKMATNKDVCIQMLPVWLSLWRDVLLKATGSSVPIINVDRSAFVEKLAEKFGMEGAKNTVSAIEYTSDSLQRNANTQLAMEVLMLDLPEID